MSRLILALLGCALLVTLASAVTSECSTHADCATDNPCTRDLCDTFFDASWCVHYSNVGAVCGGDFCSPHLCSKNNTCDPSSRQATCQSARDCDDGDKCTRDSCEIDISGNKCCYHIQRDHCQPSQQCTTDTARFDCDDSEPCTNDVCENGVCAHYRNGGDDCNSTLLLQSNLLFGMANECNPAAGGGFPGSAQCLDGNPCTLDSCFPDGTCNHFASSGACNVNEARPPTFGGGFCARCICTGTGIPTSTPPIGGLLNRCSGFRTSTKPTCLAADRTEVCKNFHCLADPQLTVGTACCVGTDVPDCETSGPACADNKICDDGDPCTQDSCEQTKDAIAPDVGFCRHVFNRENPDCDV